MRQFITAIVSILTVLVFLSVGTAQDGGEVTPSETPSSGEERPSSEGEATPAEGEATPAEGEATPAEGEATPAEGEATPAEGEATPAEGEATPAEGEAAPKATPVKPKASSDEKVPSPYKKARGHDLLKIDIGKDGSGKYKFTCGSVYTSHGPSSLLIRREKIKDRFHVDIELKKAKLHGDCKRGCIACKAGPVVAYALDTVLEVEKDPSGLVRVCNKGKGKVGIQSLGLSLELREGQTVEVKKEGVNAHSANKGPVGVIRGAKVELLKPGTSTGPNPADAGNEPRPALFKKLKGPDFLKDWFTIDTGEEGAIEFLLRDGGMVYSADDERARFEVFFMESSPRETRFNITTGAFAFDIGSDLMTVALPKVISLASRNAIFRTSFVEGVFRFEALGGELLLATTAPDLLKDIRVTVEASSRSAVDTFVDPKTKNVVFLVSPDSEKAVVFRVSPSKRKGPGREKRLLAPPGSRLDFSAKGQVVTVKIPIPEGEFSATVPLQVGVGAPADHALQDHGDLIEIKNVSPGNP